MSRTAMLINPTIDEIKRRAAEIGLPEREAEKFYHYHEANGWRQGRYRMVSWQNALQVWRMNWEERQPMKPSAEARRIMSPIQVMVHQKELERVDSRMAVIRASYSENMSWDKKDREEFQKLKARRHELKQMLGIVI